MDLCVPLHASCPLPFLQMQVVLSDTLNWLSQEAILASINFVALCCQQTAFMAGRGSITEEIQLIKENKL